MHGVLDGAGVITRPAWQAKGACRRLTPALFFDEIGGGEGKEANERAKAVCATCPVCATCLEYAVSLRIEDGIWGGTTAKERRCIVRRRRKATAA